MKRGAGYHPLLPHDVAHFIVENQLGLTGGVFGQIAAGGTGATFIATDANKLKKVKKRGRKLANENKAEAMFAEEAICAAQAHWQNRPFTAVTNIALADLNRIADQFEEFAGKWSRISIGASITLEWNPQEIKSRER